MANPNQLCFCCVRPSWRVVLEIATPIVTASMLLGAIDTALVACFVRLLGGWGEEEGGGGRSRLLVIVFKDTKIYVSSLVTSLDGGGIGTCGLGSTEPFHEVSIGSIASLATSTRML